MIAINLCNKSLMLVCNVLINTRENNGNVLSTFVYFSLITIAWVYCNQSNSMCLQLLLLTQGPKAKFISANNIFCVFLALPDF